MLIILVNQEQGAAAIWQHASSKRPEYVSTITSEGAGMVMLGWAHLQLEQD